MRKHKPQYRPRSTGYSTSALLGCLALSLGMGTIAVTMLPVLVATQQWFPAGAANFVIFVSVIGAGVSIIELIGGE